MSILSTLLLKTNLREVSRAAIKQQPEIMSTTRPISSFQSIDFIPPDIQFDVTGRFLADQNNDKINLGQGTYRDENGQPWVLPSVQMAKKSIGDFNHEYLPIAGFRPFLTEATKLLFDGTEALAKERVWYTLILELKPD